MFVQFYFCDFVIVIGTKFQYFQHMQVSLWNKWVAFLNHVNPFLSVDKKAQNLLDSYHKKTVKLKNTSWAIWVTTHQAI